MRALILNAALGPESVELAVVDDPIPGPGEVRVALKAAALNHRELWICRGLYPGMVVPSGLGADGSGIIDAVGAGVERTQIGREVVLYPGLHWGDEPRFPSKRFALFGMPLPGTLADYICVPLENAFPKPPWMTFEEAACLPTAGITAWRALRNKACVGAGERVLVTGIGGGVAVWALQFGVAMGARVYVTSSSEAKIERARQLGAQGGVLYTGGKWGRALAELAGPIDAVIDGAPAGGLSQYMRCLAMGARVVLYGSTGGAEAAFPVPDLFLKHASVHGTAMGTPSDFAAMLEFVDRHRIRPVIDCRFPIAAGREALLALRDAHGIGKITVTLEDPSCTDGPADQGPASRVPA